MIRLNPARAARLAALAALAALMVQDRCPVLPSARATEGPQEKADADSSDDRTEDRTAIRSAMQSFEAAFEAGDASALAAQWTAEGEYRSEAGELVRGREALEQGFSAFFAETPEVSAEVRPESLRFLSDDIAIEEGSVAVRRGPAEPETDAAYTALFVRKDGRWLMAQLSESPGGTTSIADLSWLVGDWESAIGEAAQIRTTYSWAPNEKFLQSVFTLKEAELELSGTQVIGVDPATGAIHTWTFEADGGVGDADWYEDGDHWVLEAAGTQPDGSTLIATNILRRVDDDTFTWQSIDRMLDDVELPDLPPVKVTRVKPEG